MSPRVYSTIIEAKDKNLIPLCKNEESGQEISLHSKYNPTREAETFAAQVSEAAFFIVLGLSGGYHIQKLGEKFPNAKIIAVEISDEAIDFLSQIPAVRKLQENKRIKITSIQNLSEILLSFYKPALHGNLSILSLRAWETFFTDEAALARDKITAALKLLSGDYSVQSHFGKIWHKNILSNLSLTGEILSQAQNDKCAQNDVSAKFPYKAEVKSKIAAVIAAGPSLDDDIRELKHNRTKYFIIATDTAFSALSKHNIQSDAVVSIDGQMISHEHFLGNLNKDTTFVFDLCSPSSSVRKTLRFSKHVILAQTGHPLAQCASFYNGGQNFLHLEAGSGTVTIAAVSFAQALGFSNDKIQFFGADFSYIKGKPYARGTYLETRFYSLSDRFETAEKAYTKLMYRTPVIKISEDKITTEILESYRLSLADFMKKEHKTASDYCQTITHNTKKSWQISTQFDFQDFKSRYCKELEIAFKDKENFDENAPVITTLLPLLAKIGKDSAFLAYLKILEYTKRI